MKYTSSAGLHSIIISESSPLYIWTRLRELQVLCSELISFLTAEMYCNDYWIISKYSDILPSSKMLVSV